MLPRNALALACCLVLTMPTSSACAQPASHAANPPPGFRALFNGHDLDAWWGETTTDPGQYLGLSPEELAARKRASLDDINLHWHATDDGVLVNDGQGLFLTTDDFFADFELRLEYRTVAGADSGVYLRGIPQVQIWDTTETGGKWTLGADKGSGGLWNNPADTPGRDPLAHADRPFGEWNALRIVMVGDRVSVWLNDRLVVDHARMHNYFHPNEPLPRTGPIQLQTHGGEIAWRNILIRDIEPEEANRILASHDTQGFEIAFDGSSFQGWRGATDDYEVRDGALACRPGRGGVLFTQRTYADFDVRLEFRLPPGANNGLAIRYPGQGDPAYAGLCELQVLDNTHPAYASLDARQYHASVYGQCAATRGYLRPPGQWNFQQVRVVGSRVTVELNGFRILDADLAEIDPDNLMYPADRFPGRTRTEGHFGFCGHNDPVAFRRIRIRELPARAPAP